MKTPITLALALSLSTSALAARQIDSYDTYLMVLERQHLDGDKPGALLLASQLARTIASDSPLKGSVAALAEEADRSGITETLEKAIKFATGKKREVYCQGKGLVELRGRHNDGAFSRVVLRASNRKVNDSNPAAVESGTWIYELSDTYRKPVNSEINMISSSPNSFHLKEVRNRGENKVDTAEGEVSWDKDEILSDRFGGFGDVSEPTSMFMAIDFHHWGNHDMGYRLDFVPGFTSTEKNTESGTLYQRLMVKSTRVVGALIPAYQVKDSSGETRSYENCYPVDYDIVLDHVIDDRFKVEGPINASLLKTEFVAFLDKATSCYQDVLEHDASLRGALTTRFQVDDKGNVLELKVGHSMNGGTGSSDKLDACLREQLNPARFTPAAAGKKAKVIATIRFQDHKAAL